MKPGERLKAYLARKQNALGLDPDIIHAFDIGTGKVFECRASDIAAVVVLLDECERVLAPFAEKWLHPDDIGPEMAAEIRADEDWDESENDKSADDVWIERGWIKAARATLAKLRGER